MPIANQIAQFGFNTGQNIQNTVGRHVDRFQAEKRENRLLDLAQQEKAQERAAALEVEERELGGAAAKTYFSAGTPEQKAQILEAVSQDFLSRGFISPEQANGFDESHMLKLAAATGVEIPGAQNRSSLANFKRLEDGGIAGFNKETGQFQRVESGGLKFNDPTPDTNINITQEAEAKGLTEEQKALGKSRVRRFEGLQNDALVAQDQNEQIRQLGNLDIETGFGERAKVQGARIFNALGVDGDELLGTDVAGAQAFNSVSGKLLAEALAAQKGPQTDRDADRIAETLPNIGNEALSNRFIMNAALAVNERKVEQAEFYEEILERDGSLKNADKQWRAFKRKTPMVSDSVLNRDTGLPMFFNEFIGQAREANPQASDEQLINAWRKLND